MKKGNKNGFTLLELLAVIIVIALVALITTPIIINVINNANRDTFKSSVEGMLRSVELHASENYMGDTYTVTKGSITSSTGEKVHTSGGKDESGLIFMNNDGDTSATIYNKTWCAKKGLEDKQITITKYSVSSCKTNDSIPTLVKTIQDKNKNGNAEGLFTDDYNVIRYRGGNEEVKNYVTFNGETWRIISLQSGSVKIIRENSIGQYAFDFRNGTYRNKWDESILMNLLNAGYESGAYNSSLYWNGTSGSCYTNNSSTNPYGMAVIKTCNFSGVKLNDRAKSMIRENVMYNFGRVDSPSYTASQMYNIETNSAHSASNLPWFGDVMIMYASDYGYAASSACTKTLYAFAEDENCTKRNWLYTGKTEWTATPYSYSEQDVISIGSNGSIIGGTTLNYAASSLEVRPTIVLKDTVSVVGGTGTKQDPYQLTII